MSKRAWTFIVGIVVISVLTCEIFAWPAAMYYGAAVIVGFGIAKLIQD